MPAPADGGSFSSTVAPIPARPIAIQERVSTYEHRRHSRAGLRHAADQSRLPRGPYRFTNREFFIITYRTDPAKLREVVPEPLQPASDLVNFEFIRMPDSTGLATTPKAAR